MTPSIDMHEATRLTRLGRLTEALAILKGRPREDASAKEAPRQAKQPVSALSNVRQRFMRGADAPFAGGSDQVALAPSDGGREVEAGPRELRPAIDLGVWTGIRGRSAAPRIPEGARFEEATFSNSSGSRQYKLYVPSGSREKAAALVVMLHGCTQSPDDFAAGTGMNDLAEEEGFLVAYPAQPSSANASKCWNWFNSGDQRRDQGEPSLIAGITRQVLAEFCVEEGRVYVAGLSAGGAAAAILGSAYPDLYAAIGVHSGLACGAARDMPSAFAAMSQGAAATSRRGFAKAVVPTIVFHGDNDRTVNPINGDQVIAQSKAGAGLRVHKSSGESAGKVAYSRTVHTDENDVPLLEQWVLHGAGHAWSGGRPAGSYTEPKGPDASREMVRFFFQHSLAGHCQSR